VKTRTISDLMNRGWIRTYILGHGFMILGKKHLRILYNHYRQKVLEVYKDTSSIN